MTHTTHSLEEILAAVYLAGISNGLHRDITDPEEIMHRKEGFIKANPVCKDAVDAIDHYTTTKIEEAEIQLLRDTADGFESELLPEFEKGGREAINALRAMADHKELSQIRKAWNEEI